VSKYVIGFRTTEAGDTWVAGTVFTSDGVVTGLDNAREALDLEMRDTHRQCDRSGTAAAEPGQVFRDESAIYVWEHAIWPLAAWKVLVAAGLAEEI